MQYFIKTFGCQMNFSDSERMATFFEQNGFILADKIDQADLVIFNTCGVRQTSEHKVYGHVHNVFKKQGEFQKKKRCSEVNPTKKKIIAITGCLTHRKEFRKRLENKVDLFFPIKDFPNILNLIKKNKNLSNKLSPIKHYHTLEYGSGCENNYLKIKPKYEKQDSALVPIMTGCNNFCTYCIVPYARGQEWSRPFNEIINEVRHLANKKYKKITLLGQNVNSYLSTKTLTKESQTKKISFPVLLDTLAKKFPKIKFKFLTSHPKDYSNQLIEVIAKNKNISRQIHLPIQAGSDKILKAMNRPYTQKHYLNLIKKTREKIPEAKISTDVIVGFPNETKKDFLETVKVFKEVGFSEAFVNKYSPRPGTASFELRDNVLLEEKKRREQILKKYF